MSKYIEIQTRKAISSYGGVGSIIETPKGAILIENFDKWPFFRSIQEGKKRIDDFVITDNRLLKRLQHLKGFPKLKDFIRVPHNVAHHKIKHEPVDKDKVISSIYFPQWFYCNNCEKFMILHQWWKRWEETLKKYGEKPIRDKFIPPVCYHCYDAAKSQNKKDGKRRRFYYELEQVRFLMTSPTGEIEDIPWERWPNAEKKSKDDDSDTDTGTIAFDFENCCCGNQELKYYKSNKFSDLAGIRIECASCGQKNTLSGLFGIRLSVPNKEKAYKKPVIRTSNSVYYPITINSIYIPTQKEINPDDQEKIKKWIEKGKDVTFIYEALCYKYETEKLEKFIKGDVQGAYEPELEYRLREYFFLTDISRAKYPNRDEIDHNLIFERKKITQLHKFGISNLTSVKRLKITTVQTAYTRQEPLDKDQFLSGELVPDLKIEAKYTSSMGRNTEYLPAIESFGEGIFIAFEKEQIENWISDGYKIGGFPERIENFWANCIQHEYVSINSKFKNENHLVRFVFIHTLAHLLMKELEFLCGYPVTSLNERLFVDNENMQGLLLYTVAGTEGSYGGLVSQSDEMTFLKIIKSALKRATDCASDPICYHEQDGQGIGGLNFAACYSCTLVPETACEEFNSFLDRALLIDKEFGFFKKHII